MSDKPTPLEKEMYVVAHKHGLSETSFEPAPAFFDRKLVEAEAEKQQALAECEKMRKGEHYWAWFFDDGSMDTELHMTKKYANINARKEEETDPSLGIIRVAEVIVIEALSTTEKEKL